MKILSSAPTKLIVAGEHAVVHGTKAIVFPIELRNFLELKIEEGDFVFRLQEIGFPEFWFSLKSDWSFEGHEGYKGIAEMIKNLFNKEGINLFELRKRFDAKLFFSRAPKGMGNSASISAVFAIALFNFFGKKPSFQELFDATMVSEKVIHVNPSGVDSVAVISGKSLVFWKEFVGKEVKFNFSEESLCFPKETELLVINSRRREEKIMTTGELVNLFSKNYFGKNPNEVSDSEKKALVKEFNPVIEEIQKELNENGSPQRLGKLFLENQELLRKGGVSSESIEEAINACMESGCFGAKGTGACGPGGAVIALVEKNKAKKVLEKLEKKGFNAFVARKAEKGTVIEKAIKGIQ